MSVVRAVVVGALLCIPLVRSAAAQADTTAAQPDTTNEDVIYLKGDRVLRGRIVDAERPGFLVLRARDGKDMVVARDQIVRVVRATPPPIPTPPPVTQRVSTVDRHGTVIETTVTTVTPVQRIVRRKEPAVAWALSFVIPGAGQYYNGQWEKGVAFMAIQVITASLYWSKEDDCQFNGPDCSARTLAIAVMFVNWIATQVDAPVSASAINRSNGVALEVGPQPHTLGLSLARVRF